MKKLVDAIHRMHCYLVGLLLGKIMYSKEYFPKGKWFESWKSLGWQWILPDFWCRVMNHRHRGIKWPVSPYTNIGGINISFDPNDLNIFQATGAYFQSHDAHLHIGRGTHIAQGVGMITSNHDVYDLEKRSGMADVIIGNYCWLGMNSIVLPGVVLGDHTIVGAGSVVTHSFQEGYCVVVGNPAHKIKDLDKSKFVK